MPFLFLDSKCCFLIAYGSNIISTNVMCTCPPRSEFLLVPVPPMVMSSLLSQKTKAAGKPDHFFGHSLGILKSQITIQVIQR